MRKKLFTFLLALVASVGLSWATTTDLASITDNYTAQDGEILTGTLGVSVKISIADGATVTLLNANINGDKTLTTGDYAGLTCLGDATITIVGTNSVSGFKVGGTYGFPGIYVPSGKTLIINGTGSLTAQSSSGYAAGIGAKDNTHCGNIEIQSGKITAIAGGKRGAGIGGADNANCGNITISGGIVTAVGGYQCSGIGGGRRGTTNAGHCGNILISGGVVSATSGENAAAIGGGRGYNNSYKSNCGTITITNTALKVYAEQGGEKGSTNTIGAGKNGNNVTVTIGGNTGVINDDPYTYRTKEDGEIVVDYINAIGSVVYTQECKDKIDIARELYDALEDSQKGLVTKYQTLLNAEAAYAALIPYTVALEDGTVNADKVTLSATSAVEGATITVTPDEEYEITAFSAYYVVVEDQLGSIYDIDATLDPGTGAYSFTMPAANVTIEATIAEKAAPTPVVLADCGLGWLNVPEGGVVGTIGHEDEIVLPQVNASLDFILAFQAHTATLRLGSTDESVLAVYGFNNFAVNGVGECDVYVVHDEDAVFAYDSAAFHVTVNPEPQPQPADVNITPNVDPDHTGVYYSTFFDSSVKYELPAGVEAYVADLSGANLLLTKIAEAGEVIPANVAVILKSTVTPFTLTVSDADAVTFTATNDLQGSDTQIATPANCYVLAGTDGVVGFYHYTASMLNPHKAYVIYSGSQAPKRMPFVFNQATGVEAVTGYGLPVTEKRIENGQLIIIKNGVKYNAQGQMVK